MNSNLRHQTVTSNFCGYDFVSIRVDDVDYFPVSQLPFDPTGNQGFPIPQKYAAQGLERLSLDGFQFHKFATILHPKKVNCISEEVLELVVDCFAFEKGCFFARQLMRASFGTQLRLANDAARGVAEEVAYYVEIAAMRAAGIKFRRLFTDVVKMQKELGFELNYGYMTLLVYRSAELIEKYNAWKVVYTTNAERQSFPFRGTLNELELKKLADFEMRCAERAMAKTIPLTQAIKDTIEFFS